MSSLKDSLLSSLARRFRDWADLLASQVTESVPVSSVDSHPHETDDPSLETGNQEAGSPQHWLEQLRPAGPPAHWLEVVRKGAPQLLDPDSLRTLKIPPLPEMAANEQDLSRSTAETMPRTGQTQEPVAYTKQPRSAQNNPPEYSRRISRPTVKTAQGSEADTHRPESIPAFQESAEHGIDLPIASVPSAPSPESLPPRQAVSQGSRDQLSTTRDTKQQPLANNTTTYATPRDNDAPKPAEVAWPRLIEGKPKKSVESIRSSRRFQALPIEVQPPSIEVELPRRHKASRERVQQHTTTQLNYPAFASQMTNEHDQLVALEGHWIPLPEVEIAEDEDWQQTPQEREHLERLEKEQRGD